MINKKQIERLIDSAILLAIFSAACYAVGYGGYVRNISDLGLPSHLLPKPSTESMLLAGAADLWLLLSILTIVSAVYVFGIERWSFLQRWRQLFRDRIEKHTRFYMTVASIIAVGVVLSYAYWAPLQRSAYADVMLPRVVDIETNSGFTKTVEMGYLTRNDGILVLKESGRNVFFFLREDDLTFLELSGSRPNDEQAPTSR